MSSTLGGWSLNHWTPREVPPLDILGHFSSNISPLPIFFFLRNAHYSFSFSAFSTSVLCVFALMVNLCLMPSERAAASGLPPASCPLSASTRSSVHPSRVSLSFQMQSIVRIRSSVMLASSFVFPVSSLLSLRRDSQIARLCPVANSLGAAAPLPIHWRRPPSPGPESCLWG